MPNNDDKTSSSYYKDKKCNIANQTNHLPFLYNLCQITLLIKNLIILNIRTHPTPITDFKLSY